MFLNDRYGVVAAWTIPPFCSNILIRSYRYIMLGYDEYK